jgi:putative ABC transport system permease protein
MTWSPVVRSVRARPGFTLFVVVICALTVATTTAIFSAVDLVLFRPPAGVSQPAGVFRLYSATTGSTGGEVVSRTFSYPQFTGLRARLASLARVAALSTQSVSVGLGTGAAPAIAEFVTLDFLPLLGTRMVAGRGFSSEDVAPPAGRAVVVVSERYARRLAARSSSALGQHLVINGRTFTVVGVVAGPFTGIDTPAADLWIPLAIAGQMLHGEVWDFDAGARWIQVIGRYRGAALSSSVESMASQALAPAEAGLAARAATYRTRARVGPIQLAWGPGRSLQARVSLWLLWIAGAVLLTGCANIGNLYVVRAAGRRREIAVRLALGATVRALFKDLLVESSIPAAFGGALGVLLALAAGRLLHDLLPDPAAPPPTLNWHVALAALASTAAVAMVAAVLPLASARSTNVTAALRDGSAASTQRRSPLRSGLAAAQVALAALLLVAAGLFLHTLHAVFAVDLGLDPQRVLIARVDLASAGRTPEEVDRFYRLALERARALPGVEAASVSATVPFSSGLALYLALPGGRSLLDQEGAVPWVNLVTPQFFRTLGMRIVQGRAFTATDRAGTERVAVVSRALAAKLWPDGSAIGQCIEMGDANAPCTRVVGVVADAARDQPTEAPALQYFVPLDQNAALAPTRALNVKTFAAADLAAPSIVRALETLDRAVPYPSVVPLSALIEPHVRPWRTAASLFTTFAAIAVILAILGLQTVVAYAVVERRRELAVRRALGGSRRRVIRLVLGDGLRLTVIGLVIGLGAAALGASKAAPFLFGTSTLEPIAYAGAAVALIVSAGIACAIPSLRALTIAPSEALRAP